MKKSLEPLLIFVSLQAAAETYHTRISKIIPSEGPTRPELYLLENGRVGRLTENKNKSLEAELEFLHHSDSFINIQIQEGEIVEVEALPSVQEVDSAVNPSLGPLAYTPTKLASLDEATKIFQHLNPRHQRDSQCYNRAHVWAYEEWRRIGLQSMKLFMFFTTRYIWEYKYEWWFHVTPMTYVGDTPYALDRTFTRGPRLVKDWTLGFIKSRRDCPTVARYSQYYQNQNLEHCYLIPASMYFWQPRDLETFEQSGVFKKNFIPSEVNHSYWEAF